MDNYIIRYDNCINSIFPTDLTKLEMNAFMYILSSFHFFKANEVNISYDKIRQVIGYNKRRTANDFDKALDAMCQKLQQIMIFSGCEDVEEDMCLFPTFSRNWYKRTLTVCINPRAKAFLMRSRGYTQFDIREFISLKSKGAKFIYINLKQFRTTGVWHVLMDDFKRRLGIGSYSNNNCVYKVLNPAIEELVKKGMFSDLSVKIERGSTKGNPIRALLFTFAPEKRSQDPDETVAKTTPAQSSSPVRSDDTSTPATAEPMPAEVVLPTLKDVDIDSFYCTSEALLGGMICEDDIAVISDEAKRCSLTPVVLKKCIYDALGRDNIRNIVGYIITLIRKNKAIGQAAVSDICTHNKPTKRSPGSFFTGFCERSYDYAALEKELID